MSAHLSSVKIESSTPAKAPFSICVGDWHGEGGEKAELCDAVILSDSFGVVVIGIKKTLVGRTICWLVWFSGTAGCRVSFLENNFCWWDSLCWWDYLCWWEYLVDGMVFVDGMVIADESRHGVALLSDSRYFWKCTLWSSRFIKYNFVIFTKYNQRFHYFCLSLPNSLFHS